MRNTLRCLGSRIACARHQCILGCCKLRPSGLCMSMSNRHCRPGMLLHPHTFNVIEFPLHPGPEYTLKLLALAGWAIIPRARAIKTPKHRSATTLPVVAMVYSDVQAGNRREERENINYDKSVLTLQGILDMCVKCHFAPRETPMPSKLLHFWSV